MLFHIVTLRVWKKLKARLKEAKAAHKKEMQRLDDLYAKEREFSTQEIVDKIFKD